MNDPYLILKTLHILVAILFLGNIIVTVWRKLMADRDGDAIVVALLNARLSSRIH